MIQGEDPTLSKSQVSLLSMVRALKREHYDILLEFQSMVEQDKDDDDSTPNRPPPDCTTTIEILRCV